MYIFDVIYKLPVIPMTKSYKNIIIIIVLYIFCLGLGYPLEKLLSELDISESKTIFGTQIILMIPILIVLIFLVRKLDLIRFNGQFKFLKLSKARFYIFPLLFLIYKLYINFDNILELESSELILIIASVILVGLTEELFFRGILLPNVILKLKGKKYYLFFSIIISSLVFGLFHFINFIYNPSTIVGVLHQVIFAFCIGCFFSGLILRTRNILIPSLFHIIINFEASISQVQFEKFEAIKYPKEFLSRMPEPSIWNNLTYDLPYNILLVLIGFILIWNIDKRKILQDIHN
jgi:membrane protease YdiL (CAAX protease family)